jgi:hypothetical protein
VAVGSRLIARLRRGTVDWWIPLRATSAPAEAGELVEESARLVRVAIGEDGVRPPPGGIAVYRGE